MIKKLLVVVLAVITALGLAACGEPKQEEPATETQIETTTEKETKAEAETKVVKETEKETETETTPEEGGVVKPKEKLAEALVGVVSADGDGLCLRSGPDSSYEDIDIVPDDTELTITAEEDGWGYTNYRDQYGWVYMEYVVLN